MKKENINTKRNIFKFIKSFLAEKSIAQEDNYPILSWQ